MLKTVENIAPWFRRWTHVLFSRIGGQRKRMFVFFFFPQPHWLVRQSRRNIFVSYRYWTNRKTRPRSHRSPHNIASRYRRASWDTYHISTWYQMKSFEYNKRCGRFSGCAEHLRHWRQSLENRFHSIVLDVPRAGPPDDRWPVYRIGHSVEPYSRRTVMLNDVNLRGGLVSGQTSLNVRARARRSQNKTNIRVNPDMATRYSLH